MAHQTDDLQIVVASILDATEAVMDNGLLVDDISSDTISKVIWLGETMDEVIAGGGVGGLPGDGDTGDGSNGIIAPDGGDEDESGVPLVLYAAIPMVLLLLFAMLLAKNRKRDVMTPAELLDLDQCHVIVGTGDPPRSFHEGMYHYTRSGARYLSTNCADCAETRRIGFFTDADLPTITEGQLYDPASPSDRSFSFDDISLEESDIMVDVLGADQSKDSSHRRKRTLVEPTTSNLGKKGSAIDVHQCSSATCRLCSYRPDNVNFVAYPRASSLAPASAEDGDSFLI